MDRPALRRRARQGPPAETSMRLLEIGVGVLAVAATLALGLLR